MIDLGGAYLGILLAMEKNQEWVNKTMATGHEIAIQRELENLPLMVRASFPAGLKTALLDLAGECDRLRADYRFLRSQIVGGSDVSSVSGGASDR